MTRRLGVLVAAVATIAVVALPSSAAVPLLDDPTPGFTVVFPQDVTATEFRSTFGDPRAGHRHQGNDLFAPKGSPVYAIADGVVTAVRTSGNAGRYLVITHGGGWESWYMHLNNDHPGTDDGDADSRFTYAPGVEVGTFVTAGELVAYVGDSGNAEDSPAHTHFELHYQKRPVDPFPYLAPAAERARLALRLAWLATLPLD